MTYSYQYKTPKQWFWRTAKKLVGHQVHEGKMVFFHENGGQTIITNWIDYDAKLGVDWFLWTKKNMEKEAGQAIK